MNLTNDKVVIDNEEHFIVKEIGSYPRKVYPKHLQNRLVNYAVHEWDDSMKIFDEVKYHAEKVAILKRYNLEVTTGIN